MTIFSWSVRKPVPTLVLFLSLLVAGLFSFTQLEVDDNPNIDISAVSVTVTQPGASPTDLETEVTKKVEDAVAALDNVDELTSRVRDGVSVTTISFILGTDSDRATNDVRNAVAQIRQNLPQDANDPVVQRLEFAGSAIMTYAVVSDQRSVEELSNLVDRDIGRALLSVPGVAQVQRLGGLDREIRVNLNPDRLLALGITATQVNDQIRALNGDFPAGESQVAGSDRNLRTLGSAPTLAEFAQTPLTLPNGNPVPLATLGTVEDGFKDLDQIARFAHREDGLRGEEPLPAVVAFSVLRSTGSSVVAVEEGVRKAVAQLETTLPSDIQLPLIFTRATSSRESYKSTIEELISGSVLTVVVVGLFLGGWRPTLITATALPLSIIPTFLAMKLLGYTLNGMTLLALALAMGNLVDDAICMVENIDRHIAMGKPPFRATLDAAQEIGLAVIATSAALMGVFIPVAFMGGIPGQFFQPFAFTVAIATLFSTLVAVTLTPLMSARLLKPHAPSPDPSSGSPSAQPPKLGPYGRVLSFALRHRLLTLALAVLLFWGSLALLPLIPKGLFGGSDQGITTVSVELPPGTTLEQSDRTANTVAHMLLQDENVDSVLVKVGQRGGNPNQATLTTNLKPKEERPLSRWDFESALRVQFQKIPGARISFESQGAGGSSKDLSIILRSENPQLLLDTANELEKEMRAIPGLVEVSSTASLVKPEIVVQPDRQRAADLGVSVQAIARTLSLAAIGDVESNLAKFDLPDRQIPIRIQLDPQRRNDPTTLENLRIPSQTGALVPLSAVATLRFGSGPAEIDRYDRARRVSVGGNLQDLALGDAYSAVKALPIMTNLPPGVTEQPDGDTEIMRDIFSRFTTALGAGVLCIYGVLVLLYSSFLTPIAILAALPLSIGGALLGLMITQKELGLFALIGIVLLMGLVTKNAILLVDCALGNERKGMSQFQAVIDSGVSRLRPIVMTSVATVAGMLPIALELGAGSEVRSPMAIAVIGGFITSTVLTLVVVPVLFTYIDNVQYRLMHGSRRRVLVPPSEDNLPATPAQELATQGQKG